MTEMVKALSKGLTVLESLFKDDFQARTVRELEALTGFDGLAIRRALYTLRRHEFVVEVPQAKTKETAWRPGEAFIRAAFQCKRHALITRQALEADFLSVTGEKLTDD